MFLRIGFRSRCFCGLELAESACARRMVAELPVSITIPLCARGEELPARRREVFGEWNEEISGILEGTALTGEDPGVSDSPPRRGLLPDNGSPDFTRGYFRTSLRDGANRDREQENERTRTSVGGSLLSRVSKARPGAPGGRNFVSQQPCRIDVTGVYLLRQVSIGEGVTSPRQRTQVVHGTVPQKCARNTLPAPSGILSRPAPGELRCHPPPTSSTHVPEVTPN